MPGMMQALRVNAKQEFDSVDFSGCWSPVRVLDTRDYDRRTDVVPWSKIYNRKDLLEKVALPINARISTTTVRDCVLVSIPSTKPTEFDCQKAVFFDLFTSMGIDLSFLILLKRGSSGAYHIRTVVDEKTADVIDSYYFEAFTYWIVYSFHHRTHSTRGLIMPEHFTGDWNHDEKWVDHIDRNVATYLDQLQAPGGLLFICFVDAVDHAESLRGAEFMKVKDVEGRNGHINIQGLAMEGSSDDYGNWSRAIGRSMQRAISIRRQTETMTKVRSMLMMESASGSSNPPWADALEFVQMRLEYGKHSLDCLERRAKNQTAVLTNLMSREDTRASVRLAKATQRDSGAMKTVAVMTMLFLPATFFAAFFSMPLIQWEQAGVLHKRFWVYWAFTIPCTIFILLAWAIITYYQIIRRGLNRTVFARQSRSSPATAMSLLPTFHRDANHLASAQ